MANELLELFKEFKSDNLLRWAKESYLFFRSPRKFIDKISDRNFIEIIPQYTFYFLIYTFSYILFSTNLSFTELFKPALLNFSIIIPTIFIYSFSALIATKKNYLKKICIFIISSNLFLSPIIILLYALFLNQENYLFRLILNSIICFQSTFIIFYFGFAIENTIKKAIKIVVVNYMIIGLLWLIATRTNFDGYAKKEFVTVDPIYDEYINTILTLDNKETIPTSIVFTLYNNNIHSAFTVQNPFSENNSHGSDYSNSLFKKSIKKNIDGLEKEQPKLKFERNKSAEQPG